MEKGKRKNGRRLACGTLVGAAILLILPVSLSSFLLYTAQGLYDLEVLIPTAIGVTVGGYLGAKLLGKLPEKKVAFLFALLQAAAGLFLFFSK